MSKKSIVQLGISLGIGAIVVVLLIFLRSFHLLDTLELKTLDYRFVLRGPYTGLTSETDLTNDSLDVVLVDIDDESWRLIPYRWPYPRDIWAQVVDNLTRAGASVVVFDIEFDTEDNKSAHGDSIFAESIRRARNQGTDVVLAAKLVREKTRVPPEYVMKPVETLMEAEPALGLINERVDLDGFSRRYIAFHYLPDEDQAYLSLAAKAAAEYRGIPESTKISQEKGYIHYGPMNIRTFQHPALFLINYYGPPSAGGPDKPLGPWGTFHRYPLSNVLDDSDFELKFPQEDSDWMELFYKDGALAQFGLTEQSPFEDKIVMVGVSLEDFHDVKETPYMSYGGYQHLMPGVETHANAVQTILDGNYIRDAGTGALLTALILLVALTAGVVAYAKPLIGGLVSIVLGWAYVDYAFGLFFQDFFWSIPKLFNFTLGRVELFQKWAGALGMDFGVVPPDFGESIYLPVVVPLLGIILTYVGNVVYQFISEQREKRWVKDAFGHFLSPKVVSELMEDPERLSLGGERRYLTVLFSDIQGFTTVSEKMEPEALAEFLNEYLTELTDIILSYNGIIDKYEGDAIMAEFGAPLETDDHAIQACSAALDCQFKLKELREKWLDEGLPEIHTRFGINSGIVALGNFGSKDVFDYTVMGDTVNLGARLESANKQYGTYIMISKSTREEIKEHFRTRFLDSLVVKGKTEPIKVYELLGRLGEDTMPHLKDKAILEPYNSGIEHYFNREWDAGIQAFTEALEIDPDDGPSQLFLERCRSYKKNPPPEDWDGAFTMTSK
ncbi:MAG: adenylate/guanylate cyclase domain-containing protein [Candidatus Marinimicrobia bacterium]|nr:adenylate/guanylate cyclase domain-containing protein [Candidatus Neomarinimicrobiota bacterium]MCF7829807.1 adenylate/guanylate cyclase domain-containing protein [Candidatus Neomarinimicrobiota bacterium]MCF7881760.1 adenylate/guanylate cyclase domain-containing protein [Candidatus Neomarinimicrobiota bacterium]